MLPALAAEIPPEVRIAPVVEEDVSSVLGANKDALAPVPPIVRSVVAPANAVNEVDGVVMLVAMSGDVIVWTPVNVFAASVRARVADVVGNVIVVASVPARVSVLFMVATLPEATVVPSYIKSQLAAVVGVATNAVNKPDVAAHRITIVFEPEDCTVTAPVELLMIKYCCPATILVVGSLQV